MIISQAHSFIFAAVPKTGTHSVRRALRRHIGEDDWEQVGLFVRKQLPIPELARLQHGHISLEEVRQFLPADTFDRFFKFAFVRNPFDRFVSYCAFMTRNGDAFEHDPKAVMRHFISSAPPTNHVLFRPQHSFVTDNAGQLLTDFVGRVETMQQSYDSACERIGIPSEPLEHVNASRRRPYQDYYDQELAGLVAKTYARDLSLFGYEF